MNHPPSWVFLSISLLSFNFWHEFWYKFAWKRDPRLDSEKNRLWERLWNRTEPNRFGSLRTTGIFLFLGFAILDTSGRPFPPNKGRASQHDMACRGLAAPGPERQIEGGWAGENFPRAWGNPKSLSQNGHTLNQVRGLLIQIGISPPTQPIMMTDDCYSNK